VNPSRESAHGSASRDRATNELVHGLDETSLAAAGLPGPPWSVHPGEVLLEEFLKPMDISQYQLAKDISVPPRRINEIVLGKRTVTADTALRLSRYLGTSERFWLNLQARYDLEVEKDRLGRRLAREVRVLAEK
jgi:addiction module HigA family antidote